jgi:hypothetical protein
MSKQLDELYDRVLADHAKLLAALRELYKLNHMCRANLCIASREVYDQISNLAMGAGESDGKVTVIYTDAVEALLAVQKKLSVCFGIVSEASKVQSF